MSCKMDKAADTMTFVCDHLVHKVQYPDTSLSIKVTNNHPIDWSRYVSFIRYMYVKHYEYMDKIIVLSKMKYVSRLIKKMNACSKSLRDRYVSKLDLAGANVNTFR